MRDPIWNRCLPNLMLSRLRGSPNDDLPPHGRLRWRTDFPRSARESQSLGYQVRRASESAAVAHLNEKRVLGA